MGPPREHGGMSSTRSPMNSRVYDGDCERVGKKWNQDSALLTVSRCPGQKRALDFKELGGLRAPRAFASAPNHSHLRSAYTGTPLRDSRVCLVMLTPRPQCVRGRRMRARAH